MITRFLGDCATRLSLVIWCPLLLIRFLCDYGENLRVEGDLNLDNCNSLRSLSNNLVVGGCLFLSGCELLTTIPASLQVGRDVVARGCSAELILRLYELKELGQIKGKVIYD